MAPCARMTRKYEWNELRLNDFLSILPPPLPEGRRAFGARVGTNGDWSGGWVPCALRGQPARPRFLRSEVN